MQTPPPDATRFSQHTIRDEYVRQASAIGAFGIIAFSVTRIFALALNSKVVLDVTDYGLSVTGVLAGLGLLYHMFLRMQPLQRIEFSVTSLRNDVLRAVTTSESTALTRAAQAEAAAVARAQQAEAAADARNTRLENLLQQVVSKLDVVVNTLNTKLLATKVE